MTDESKLILGAMKKDAPQVRTSLRRKRKIGTDDIIDCTGTDIFIEHAKKLRKEPKQKMYVSQWTSTDFLRYFSKNLSAYGLELESFNIRDRDWMNKLYDLFVDEIGTDMNNRVLRDYIDWWCGTYVPAYINKSIYVNVLMGEKFINQFVEYWRNKTHVTTPTVKVESNIGEKELYELSGLSALLVSRGIVSGCRVLQRRGNTNYVGKVSQILDSLSEEMLEKVLQNTMKTLYSREDMVDFISISRKPLQSYGITKYDSIDFREYFKEV